MPTVIRFHELGGPEVLKFEEVPKPQPGPREVRLKVQAVGLNRAESMFYHGHYLEQPKLPSGLGYEAAGVVEAIGPDVDKQWLGKRVATIPGFSMSQYGMLGEEVLAPVYALGEYPERLTPAEASSIWMQFFTAYGALIHFGQLKKADFVIIPAASSSVGLAAIQIVKSEGATSIALTRSSSKREALQNEGADHVIATGEEDLVARVKEITGGRGARLVFDCVGGTFVEKLVQATAFEGILFEYGLLSMEPTPFPLLQCLPNGIAMRGYSLMEITQKPELLGIAKTYVTERIEDGRFHPTIAKSFPFAQTIEAYRYLESNAQVGKVVITF